MGLKVHGRGCLKACAGYCGGGLLRAWYCGRCRSDVMGRMRSARMSLVWQAESGWADGCEDPGCTQPVVFGLCVRDRSRKAARLAYGAIVLCCAVEGSRRASDSDAFPADKRLHEVDDEVKWSRWYDNGENERKPAVLTWSCTSYSAAILNGRLCRSRISGCRSPPIQCFPAPTFDLRH